MKLTAIGDSGIKVEFPGEVTTKLNQVIQQFCVALQDAEISGVIEWVPAFNSVTIYYDPTIILFHELAEKMNRLVSTKTNQFDPVTQLFHVPVLYGGNVGPDLERVASYNNLSIEEVIKLHQQPNYFVYMIGFLPGFPYLGGLNPIIATPRLDEPRKSTFAGAVGIAHEQTGIYPMESPGGWNIIGKTPIKLFRPEQREEVFQFKAGDMIRFYEVSKEEFQHITDQVDAGVYKLKQEIIENN
ncbi:5-oxoprolinase subunit PxpB [Ornithinibacillus sp. L9]|uniref:5-oxoprolinase subunit PxpB n=1 Tax=Ornithinibacillus caprae TaxID=2678566 RepID=A0A6N8FHJ1_9BACI|nr:5-oxoprolinase subunit PxpB [Ornithinibacillus caprae]MUK89050.1 5-oxoprolinase subunit PxpB [Ornithinibacillus caprae]